MLSSGIYTTILWAQSLEFKPNWTYPYYPCCADKKSDEAAAGGHGISAQQLGPASRPEDLQHPVQQPGPAKDLWLWLGQAVWQPPQVLHKQRSHPVLQSHRAPSRCGPFSSLLSSYSLRQGAFLLAEGSPQLAFMSSVNTLEVVWVNFACTRDFYRKLWQRYFIPESLIGVTTLAREICSKHCCA